MTRFVTMLCALFAVGLISGCGTEGGSTEAPKTEGTGEKKVTTGTPSGKVTSPQSAAAGATDPNVPPAVREQMKAMQAQRR